MDKLKRRDFEGKHKYDAGMSLDALSASYIWAQIERMTDRNNSVLTERLMSEQRERQTNEVIKILNSSA